jgi:hypothetical protein
VSVLTPHSWQKSSFSGGDEGDACVEVAHLDTHIAIRDSKTPDRAILAFPPSAFTPFIQSLKHPLPTTTD